MLNEYDIVIIGSGAGGAPIAYEMAIHGKSVLVLEKGPLFLPQDKEANRLSDFKRDELYGTGPEKKINIAGVANNGAAYFSSHVEPDLNDEPHVYLHNKQGVQEDRATIEGYTAQVVGGGTQLYGAVSLRFTEDDLRLQSFNAGRNLPNDPNGDIQREARDWPVNYQQLEPYYSKAEMLIGINGSVNNQAKNFSGNFYQTPLSPNPISSIVEKGMDTLGMKRYRTPLAVITEDHAPSNRKAGYVKTGYVNRYGDPMGYKSNTWVALLKPISHLPNFTLRCNCTVTHIGVSNGKADKVFYRDESGYSREVKGKLIVIACSAIESVRLLMLSAMQSGEMHGRLHANNQLLGKYFITHCFGGAETRVPGRFDKSISLDSDWATDHCAKSDFIIANGLWAGGAIYNNTSDQALPISLARTHGSQDMDTIWQTFASDNNLCGENLLKFIKEDFGTRLSVSFMANQVPLFTNRIELHPTVKDKWGRPAAYIIKDWHPHDVFLMNVLANQCAEILRKGTGNNNVDFGGIYMAENAQARIANHILGGARFGSDKQDSVLDPNCRVWEFDNLYVTDGSFMPTSGGANPTLTIQANAFRVADFLKTII